MLSAKISAWTVREVGEVVSSSDDDGDGRTEPAVVSDLVESIVGTVPAVVAASVDTLSIGIGAEPAVVTASVDTCVEGTGSGATSARVGIETLTDNGWMTGE